MRGVVGVETEKGRERELCVCVLYVYKDGLEPFSWLGFTCPQSI